MKSNLRILLLSLLLIPFIDACDYQAVDTFTISGKVTCNDEALSGVVVTLLQGSVIKNSAVTDDSGDYSFGSLAEGTWLITPENDGYTFTPPSISVTLGSDKTNLDFTAYKTEETRSISGRVIFNGGALRNAVISASQNGTDFYTASTDTNGRYLINALPVGVYVIAPALEGYTFTPQTDTADVTDGDVVSIDFIAQAELMTGSIGGTITLDGAPQADVAVTASRNGSVLYTASTGSTGGYFFGALPAGAYTITPSMAGYTFAPQNETVTITMEDVNSIDFTAVAGSEPPAGGPVKIVLVGDICFDRGVETSVINNGGDYSFPFVYVGDYLRSADLTFGNLESIISDKGSNTKPYSEAAYTQVSFRAAPAAVNGLTYAGFDVVSVANNHLGDYDFAGMTDSMNRVKAAGISCVGGGNNYAEAHAPVIKEVKGMRIAFLAYSNVDMFSDYVSYTSPTSKWIARTDRAGLAWASDTTFATYGNLDAMRSDIAAAKGNADIVIVSIHSGTEYTTTPNAAQIAFAHAAIDSGASLVVGHHPHVIQTTEVYKGCYIVYSLGNFIFDQSAAGTARGMIVEAQAENGAISSVTIKYSNYNNLYQAVME